MSSRVAVTSTEGKFTAAVMIVLETQYVTAGSRPDSFRRAHVRGFLRVDCHI